MPQQELALMKEIGITHILAIVGTPPVFPDEFKYLWFGDMSDDSGQPLTEYLKEGLKFMVNALDENQ